MVRRLYERKSKGRCRLEKVSLSQAREGNGSVLNGSRGLGALGEDRCGTAATVKPFQESVALEHPTSVRRQRAASLGG